MTERALKCGLLGRKLGHSYSPQIHSLLSAVLEEQELLPGGYTYELFEREPEDVGSFLKNGDFDGINVTIPYKKDVIPFLDELSENARSIGSVNTIIRRPDGTLYGDNTDLVGFADLIRHGGFAVERRKALVLGTGGASVTAVAVLKKLGAGEIVLISRSGENNYENLEKHADAELIVNCSPAGMYPNNGGCLVDLRLFPKLAGVADMVYNPSRTELLLRAERAGIPAVNGLYMLVSQAKRAAELFTGCSIADSEVARIEGILRAQMQNIALIGMPGCGKTTIAALLGEKLGRAVVDTDALIVERGGKPIPEIFRESGEAFFRELETEAAAEAGKLSGKVLATGGGMVTRPENYPLLHQNSVIVWIRRDWSRLPVEGRPISQKTGVEALYRIRKPLYEAFADVVVDNNGTPEETVEAIIRSMT